jgi:hypothetical protein
MDRLAELREFVRRGQAAQAEIDGMLRQRGLAPAVHFLRHGVSPCGMLGVPAEWPPGHRWSSEWADVTCPRCIAHGVAHAPAAELAK